jgi:hypothetical protein
MRSRKDRSSSQEAKCEWFLISERRQCYRAPTRDKLCSVHRREWIMNPLGYMVMLEARQLAEEKENAYEIAQEIRGEIEELYPHILRVKSPITQTNMTSSAVFMWHLYHRLGDIEVRKTVKSRNGEKNDRCSSFSLPTSTVETMDLIAKRAGVSRSSVFRAAIDEFLATNKDVITGLRSTSEAEASFISDIRGIR